MHVMYTLDVFILLYDNHYIAILCIMPQTVLLHVAIINVIVMVQSSYIHNYGHDVYINIYMYRERIRSTVCKPGFSGLVCKHTLILAY